MLSPFGVEKGMKGLKESGYTCKVYEVPKIVKIGEEQ